MSSRLHARRMRAAAHRMKAGGERFLGGVLPGATARRLQTRAFADEWAAANLDARQSEGPLWVVLGDSTSQGVGATMREAGYVGVVHELLRRRDAWRVINLSRAGAGVADVLGRQLPELAALAGETPVALVSCVIGAEDVARRMPGLQTSLRSVLAALPTGAVVATVPHARHLDAVVREEAGRHGLLVAELGARAGSVARGREVVRLNDVGHAVWASVFMAALDGVPAEPRPAPPVSDRR